MRIIKEVRRLGKDSVDLLIDLKVIYSTIFGRTALSAERKEKIEIPGLPEITVLKTEYIKREGKTFFVEATVSIKNKGSLELTIADLHYDLKAEDLFRAREKTPVKIELKPRSDTTLILPIKIEMDKLLKTAVKVLLDKDVVNYDLYVKGNIYSDKADLEGVPVEVKKAGRMELKK